jgi:ABC-type iron transport system FetAB permease component
MGLTPEQVLILEQMIDANTLADVLDSLAEIAHAKAQHIEENWQDVSLARTWDNAGKRIESCAVNSHVCAVSRR